MEALHPSTACRSARVIRGSHFVSKSHHKSVCPEEETTLTLSGDSKHRNSQMCVRNMGEVSSKAATKKYTLNVFHLLDSPAAVSLQFFNNSEPEDRRQPCFLYLSPVFVTLAPCSIL